jgi:hypothetical protein
MKIVSMVLLILVLALGVLAYRQHQVFLKVDAERFSPNPNGTVSVELFGPSVRKTDNAETTRNLLIAGCTVSVLIGVGHLVGSIRKQKGSGV